MNNLKKVGLTALGTALVSTASVAGDMSVTGSAIITFTGNDNSNKGNGWTMSDTMSFSGSGDLDNGWTVSYSHAIDNGTNDANSITIDMGDAGSLVFAGLGGSGPVEATDDVMPTANEESWATVAGTVSGLADGSEGDSNFTYTLPEMVDGLAANVFYQPSAAAQGSSTEWKLVYTGIENLELGYAGGDNEDTLTNTIENTNLWAKYTMDAFTIGYQANEENEETASADTDFTAFGISYAVNDELSVSLGMSETEHENTSLVDQEAEAISFSYVSGGMTIGGSMHNVDNVGGTAATDNSGYELNVTFAF
jgi:outer membrane protein OmpU|tara:strand:- start:576 stop:1502 length:927 start_codon:yes stop_codon:yes gene_type:complete